MDGRPDFLSSSRDALGAQREQVIRRLRSLDLDFATIVNEAQLASTDDEHDPEGATLAFERSQASALLASGRQQLIEIDAALARIEAGTFGACERCAEPIAQGRLEARPTSRTCMDCAVRSA